MPHAVYLINAIMQGQAPQEKSGREGKTSLGKVNMFLMVQWREREGERERERI